MGVNTPETLPLNTPETLGLFRANYGQAGAKHLNPLG